MRFPPAPRDRDYRYSLGHFSTFLSDGGRSNLTTKQTRTLYATARVVLSQFIARCDASFCRILSRIPQINRCCVMCGGGQVRVASLPCYLHPPSPILHPSPMRHVLSATVQNVPGVLAHVAG